MRRSAAFAALCSTVVLLGVAVSQPPRPVPPSHTVKNPTLGNPLEHYAASWQVDTDASHLQPNNYPNVYAEKMDFGADFGWNYDPQPGVNPMSKPTFVPRPITVSARGSGQRFCEAGTLYANGSGDAFHHAWLVDVAGGVSADGDEGQGFGTTNLRQSRRIAQARVTAVAGGTGSTSLTAAVKANLKPQTVAVASAAEFKTGQWVLVEPANIVAANYPSMEAVKLTGTDAAANTVTAVFRRNHPAGAVIQSATVLTIDHPNGWGQGRWVVNLTHPGYAAGTALPTANTVKVVGAGTSWAPDMVGGDATNPGMISFAADDYAKPPYRAGDARLRVWYPIIGVQGPTALTIRHRSVAAHTLGYTGNQKAPGAYEIRPGQQVLAFDPTDSRSSNKIVLGPGKFTWNVGDTVECAHSCDFDVSGEYTRLEFFSPGGTYRNGHAVINIGGVMFQNAFLAQAAGPVASGTAFDACFRAQAPCNVGLSVVNPKQAAIQIAGNQGAANHIVFGAPTSRGIFYNPATQTLTICGAGNFGSQGFSNTAPTGQMIFSRSGASADLYYGGTVGFGPGTSKRATLDASGLTAVRTLKVPNQNGTLVVAPADPPAVRSLNDVIAVLRAAGLAK